MNAPAEQPSDPPAAPAKRVGRPRHPWAEDAVRAAVLAVVGERGVWGTSVDQISSRAGLAKSGIYLRWRNGKPDLLRDALATLLSEQCAPDESMPIRDYLIAHARAHGDELLGKHGPALVQLYASAFAGDTLFDELRARGVDRRPAAVEGRIARAVAGGEITPTMSADRLRTALEGAVFAHVLAGSPAEDPDVRRAGVRALVPEVVDALLRPPDRPQH